MRLLVIALLLALCPLLGANDWPTLEFIERGTLSTGHEVLTGAAPARDGSGRLLVSTQTGKVLVWQSDSFHPDPFLNISERLPSSSGEGGITDICLAPDYATSGTFYLCYNRIPDGASVIARFQVSESDPNLANPDSEEVLLVIPRPSNYHVGGDIEFGPDGYLYISSGDGAGDPKTSQDLTILLGKILRIDVTSLPQNDESYLIPQDNPFTDRNDGTRHEIWSFGLRNPWRISFDSETNELLISDVGSNNREEINVCAPGASGQNFGWPILEGTLERDVPPGFDIGTLTPPWLEYGRSFGTCVIGGVTVRGSSDRLNGIHWFADRGRSKILGVDPSTPVPSAEHLGTVPQAPSAFVLGEGNEIYILTISKLYEMVDTGHCLPPTIETNGSFDAPSEMRFTAPTPGSVVHYTLDGSDPDSSSPSVPEGVVVAIDGIRQINARCFRDDLLPSSTSTRLVSFTVSQPKLSFAAMQGADLTMVAGSTTTPGATLRFTLDGSIPTLESPLFANGLIVDETTTLKVRGFKENYNESRDADLGSKQQFVGTSVDTLTGNGTKGNTDGLYAQARFRDPTDLVWTPDNQLYIADAGNHRIRRVDLNRRRVSTLAGSSQGNQDGAGAAARFNSPQSITYDPNADCFYVAESGNYQIRRITRDGVVTTLTTTSREPRDVRWNQTTGVLAWSEWASLMRLDSEGNAEQFSGIGSANTNFFSGSVRFVDDEHGNWFALSGGLKFVKRTDGSITPWVPQTAQSGLLETVDGPRALSSVLPSEHNRITRDNQGNLYYSAGNSVHKLIQGKWQVSLAGLVTSSALVDGDSHTALFSKPSGLTVDASGKVYVADQGNHAIRTIVQDDSDGDLVPDTKERFSSFLTIGINDARVDTDGDGFSDAFEYHTKSDPLDNTSKPSMDFSLDGGQASFEWKGVDSLNYLIESSEDLNLWVPIGPLIQGTNGTLRTSHPIDILQFYRLVPLSPPPFEK